VEKFYVKCRALRIEIMSGLLDRVGMRVQVSRKFYFDKVP
jgi:hypothetical protein